MFNPSRDQARRFFFDAWEKHKASRPLTPLEAMAADVVIAHPEYHAVLDHPERNLDRDYLPESGDINPFLHLQLHLAVEEQLSIDQPPGILAHYHRLLSRDGDAMAAQHHIMECLAETIWQAQRQGTGPDAMVYLGCLERR
jgi:Domain of unknown function (DUF1841).